jgi:hypothetical protein
MISTAVDDQERKLYRTTESWVDRASTIQPAPDIANLDSEFFRTKRTETVLDANPHIARLLFHSYAVHVEPALVQNGSS